MADATSTSGFHHLAVSTKDMKAQLEFFTQVLGMPLVGIFDMHGVEGAIHAFVQLDATDGRCLSFTQVPGNEQIEPVVGVTHAGNGAGTSAPGTMQHLAFAVADRDALLALQDRLRSNGVVVLGPIDHGLCESIYFAGPEGLALEAAWSSEPIDERRWVDPSACERVGISVEEMAAMVAPQPFDRPTDRVPQPGIDPAKPHLVYPPDEYAKMVSLPDHVITKAASVPDPPVAV
jgi:catechol 2,3-dioxygenase-like lactoylglutathione lyase family enzyme